MKTEIRLDREKSISKIDERLYGSFIEHLGRAVYGGVYEPEHPTADDCGFRQDVLELVRQLRVSIVRYPGGNFVSGYNWEDGIGDKSKRPRKMELAWFSVEPNQVGVDEFQEWAKRAGSEILMTVNLGTRGPAEAQALVEYCNGTADTYYADLRRKNGFEQPFGIKTWCLGNEMDGPWQIGHKTAQEYARVAHEAGKMMKWTDESIELVACGSSGPGMPTFGSWERTVLDECYDVVDYLSLHSYYGNQDGKTGEFLAKNITMDAFIRDTAAICDEIKAAKGSDKTIDLSFDEWNVWFHSNGYKAEKWQVAPPLLQDVYTFEDALLVGLMLITLIKNADRVKIACLAQLVNVIAPIMTEDGGRAWAQTIFYPFLLTSAFGRGTSLQTECVCGTYPTQEHGDVPVVDAAAVLQQDGKTVSVFAVNRSEQTQELTVSGPDFDGKRPLRWTALECDDLQAVNTADVTRVAPVEKPTDAPLTLAPYSWNLLTYLTE